MKRFVCSLAALMLLCVPFSSEAAIKAQKISIATANPPGSLHVFACDKFADFLEKESAGAIKVDRFYSASMGDEQTNVKQLKQIELNATVAFAGNVTPMAPTVNLFLLSFLFPQMTDAQKLFSNQDFMNKIGDRVVKESAARPLAWLIGGYRNLTNSKHPITNINELKGLKFRVSPNDTQLAAFRAWGVEPQPIAWSETFQALQQGVCDGQENPHSVNRDQKFWEVQKYITPINYMLWVGPLMVSEKWYRKLDPETKDLVNRAAKYAQEEEWKWIMEQDAIALKTCTDRGMQVDNLTDTQVWIDKARATWPNFYDRVGGKDLVDAALAAMK